MVRVGDLKKRPTYSLPLPKKLCFHLYLFVGWSLSMILLNGFPKNKKSVIMLTCNRANFKLSIIKISVVKRKKTAFYFHKCVFLYLHEGLFSSNVGKQQCKNTQKDFQSRSIHGTICRFPL